MQLEQGKILLLVFRLTIPAVIAQLITFLYNIVDRMYVARIEDSGMDALAALGIVLPITLIIQSFANLIGLGGSPRAGIKLGEENREEANRIFNTSFLLLFILGILLGAITFLFSRPIVVLFGCPPSAIEFAVSYLRIYSCGTIFPDGLYYVFCPNDITECQYRSGTGKTGIGSGSYAKDNYPDSAMLCINAFPWFRRGISVRRNCRSGGRHDYCNCHFYKSSENFPETGRRGKSHEG